MDDEELYCDGCGIHFDNAFEMVDHHLEDDDEFDPCIVLPNGIKLMVGSLLRFLFEHAEYPEQIRQITQSTYVTLYAAESDSEMLDELIEEVVVGSEMLKFDSSLKKLLEENKPNETDEGGAWGSMADYRTSGWDGLQHYVDNLPKRDAYGNPHNPSAFIKNVEDTFNELQELLIKKHLDYGPKNISESPGGPINGLRVRMHDKLARINNLVDRSVSNPQYESLEDSFKDMANYAIIGLLVLRNKWDKWTNNNFLIG